MSTTQKDEKRYIASKKTKTIKKQKESERKMAKTPEESPVERRKPYIGETEWHPDRKPREKSNN